LQAGKQMFSMALWFYKWLGFLLLFTGRPESASRSAHPFHVSVTEVNHNAAGKSLEISCKLFTDDFEATLAKNYNTRADLIRPVNRAAMDSLVKKYIQTHLLIQVGGRPVRLQYLGFEQDRESVYAYLEAGGIEAPAELKLSNSLLYDQFTDQVNIMHVTVGGKRQSTRVLYPDREATLRF
jgi:hypothetical protein